jgi:hypothetical protein
VVRSSVTSVVTDGLMMCVGHLVGYH